jgi:hypothetical protein
VELDGLTRDLPALPAAQPEPALAASAPVHRTVAVHGQSKRLGRWRPAARSSAVAVMGSCVLDLRQAQLDRPVVDLTAVAVMGEVCVLVPERWEVDLSGLPLMGVRRARTGTAAPRPGAPVVRVRGYAVMGSVEVKARTAADRVRGMAGAMARRLAPARGPQP